MVGKVRGRVQLRIRIRTFVHVEDACHKKKSVVAIFGVGCPEDFFLQR